MRHRVLRVALLLAIAMGAISPTGLAVAQEKAKGAVITLQKGGEIQIEFFPDDAPVTFTREYRPGRVLGKGSVIDKWILSAARGGLTITIPRSAKEPLETHPWPTLEAAADAGIYTSSGRVVVTSEAFEAVIQMIADHIARGY